MPKGATVRLHISSAQRVGGQSGQFKVMLEKPIMNVMGSRMISCMIPMTWNNIQAGHKTLSISDSDAWAGDLVIPQEGIYDADTLATTMTTALEAMYAGSAWEDLGASFGYDMIAGKMYIKTLGTAASEGKSIKILGSTSDTSPWLINLLGAERNENSYDVPLNTIPGTHFLTNKYSGSMGVHTIYVLCKELANHDQFASDVPVLQMGGCVGCIPVDYDQDTDRVHYTPNPGSQIGYTFQRPRRIEMLEFTFIAHTAANVWRIIDFGGIDVYLEFDVDVSWTV